MRRSIALYRAFRHEADDPDRFYDLLARDAAHQLISITARTELAVLDVGGGSGDLGRTLELLGATCVTLDIDLHEMRRGNQRARRAVAADGRSLPFAAGTFDVVHASNVLEHVPDPWRFLDELVRVAVPGGIVHCSFTNWWSPWGGHETSPWHWLGGERAARRYERRHGHSPKNRFGESLFPVHVRDVLAWAKQNPDVDLVDAYPRYYPRWAKLVVALPGIRELLTWNLSLVLRRRF